MTITVPATTLISRMHEFAERKATAPAYTFLGTDGRAERILSYADLRLLVRATATALRARLRPGDRALLLLPEGLDFVPTFLGCLEAGVIAVPAYPPLPVQSRRRVDTLRAIVRDCRPAVVVSAAPEDVVASVRGAVPELRDTWWASARELAATPAEGAPEFRVEAEDVAFLQYTSGSTAAPKGVVVTHEQLAHNEELQRTYMEHADDVRMVSWLPLFHDMGLIGNVLHTLWCGGDAVLMSPLSFVKRPARWLRAISDHRGRTNGGPNFAYDLCTRRVTDEECEGLDLSCWRVAFNGAEPVRAATLRAFADRFAPFGFDPTAAWPCYGLAEATLIVTGSRVGVPATRLTVDRTALQSGRVRPDPAGQELVSSGITCLDRTVLVVDPETSRPVPDDAVGEIWVGGPSLPREYWNRPEVSVETFAARPIGGPDEPHMRTGDLGFVRDGELFVTGRIKDVIIVGGRNHYPQDVELTVEQAHTAIRPGAVVAFSYEDEASGTERVVVVVGVGEGAAGDGPEAAVRRAEISRSVRVAVAGAHGIALDDVAFVSPGAVPKTSSGKLQRGLCRISYLGGEYTPRDGSEKEGS